jgi:hypothetical protein
MRSHISRDLLQSMTEIQYNLMSAGAQISSLAGRFSPAWWPKGSPSPEEITGYWKGD